MSWFSNFFKKKKKIFIAKDTILTETVENRKILIEKENKKYLKENPKSTIVPAPSRPKISQLYRKGVFAIEDRLRKTGAGLEKPMKGCSETVYADFFSLKHSFAEGIYKRELFIPKGMFIVAYLHRDSYFSWIVSGKLTMLVEEGGKLLEGSAQIVSPAGSKRILYAHEDSVWVTVHPNPTNNTNLEELEAQIHVLEGGYEMLTDIITVGEEPSTEIDVDRFIERFFCHCKMIDDKGGKLCLE